MSAIDNGQPPVVCITGASSGIGAAAATAFAQNGYAVVLAARRLDRLESIACSIQKAVPGTICFPMTCDVASDDSVRTAFTEIENKFGRLDVLVNNAGFGVYGTVENTSVDVYKNNFETNVFGVVRCVQAALPLLRKAVAVPPAGATRKRRWGASIVMVSSIVGRRAMPLLSSYSATKFALEALSESLRIELWDEHIAVAVVNPGVTRTEFVGAAQGKRPAGFLKPDNGMSPEAVAHIIVSAAHHPPRNAYLTAAGKCGVALQWLAPSIFDHLLLRTFRNARG